MGTKDPRIDAYIEKAQPFAKPILRHLRKVVHAGCPDVEETLKWSAPHFTYRGMLCGMQAFKQHCAFGFWKGSLIKGVGGRQAEAMGQFGRIMSIEDLPAERTLVRMVKEAAALNEQGVKVERTGRKRPSLEPPPDLVAALTKNRKARDAFDAFSPSHRREYVEWITDAKRDDTRQRRLAAAIEWLSEGKPHNWRYSKQ